jgi:hypothetical protein
MGHLVGQAFRDGPTANMVSEKSDEDLATREINKSSRLVSRREEPRTGVATCTREIQPATLFLASALRLCQPRFARLLSQSTARACLPGSRPHLDFAGFTLGKALIDGFWEYRTVRLSNLT